MVAQMYRQELPSKASNVDKSAHEVSRSTSAAADAISSLSVPGASLLDGLSLSSSPPTTFIEHDSRSSASDDENELHASASETSAGQLGFVSASSPQVRGLLLVEGLATHNSLHADRNCLPSHSPDSSLSLSPYEVSCTLTRHRVLMSR